LTDVRVARSVDELYGRKEVTIQHVLPHSIGGCLVKRIEENKKRYKGAINDNEGACKV